MTDEISLYVPVVAHRLYGTKYVRQETAERPLVGSGLDPLQIDIGAFTREETDGGFFTAEIDTTHGSQLSSLQRVRAMFIPDESDFDFHTFTDGLTVNRIWESASIYFHLVATIDHMISSQDADWMGMQEIAAYAGRFNRSGVLNLYLVRNIFGANGRASMYRPNARADTSYVLLSDYDEELWGEINNWLKRVTVLAHEFGHFLGLTHVVERDNVMRNGGVSEASTKLEKPQWRIAQHRARYFRSLLYLREHSSSIPHLGVELDHIELPSW